jgi:hypothetical protein
VGSPAGPAPKYVTSLREGILTLPITKSVFSFLVLGFRLLTSLKVFPSFKSRVKPSSFESRKVPDGSVRGTQIIFSLDPEIQPRR